MLGNLLSRVIRTDYSHPYGSLSLRILRKNHPNLCFQDLGFQVSFGFVSKKSRCMLFSDPTLSFTSPEEVSSICLISFDVCGFLKSCLDAFF